MKAAKIFSERGKRVAAHNAAKGCVAAVLVVLIGLTWDLAVCRAQQPDKDVPGAQVLTRGPVHEAFAGMVTFNPEPGVVVTKAPPASIEEVPPEQRPQGDNVTWIPGYWAWDDERNDFLWVSGTWRALPPGRQWMAGYWGKTTQGYQWTSGYWADAAAKETTYLPPPPATVEAGPNIVAPSVDYGWTPGCWMWYQGRYAWGPGYWVQGRADWDWCPAHYVWTPRGYLFVGGFWDYPVERRGVLFAPVYFDAGVYSRRGYFYSPTIVIELGVFSDHLFLRPHYQHYYFGDYYAASYAQGGFYASFAFQSSRYGYDPIYSQQRWAHRQDGEWEHRAEASYQYRRDNETARPPRTWAAQKNINPSTAESKQNPVLMATPIDQLAKSKDGPMRFQPVAKAERQKLAQRGQEVQTSRDERRTLEAKAVAPAAQKPGAAFEPAKVKLTRSPIVAKPVNQLGKNQAPPKVPLSPKPNLKVQSQPETAGRSPSVDRSNPQPEPRKAEADRPSTPGRSEAAPGQRQIQPEAQPRVKESGAKVQEPLQRSGTEAERATPLEPQSRAKVEAAVKTAEDPQRNVRGLEPNAQPETAQRVNAPAVKAQATPPRSAGGMEKQAQPGSQPSARGRPSAGERGATKLLKNDQPKQGNGKSSSTEKPPAP